jgi:hypothetical protein
MQPHRGVLILVFGILGLVMCQIFSIVAWVMGKSDLAEMDAGRMDPEGRSLTKAGQILGIIGTLLFVVGLLFALVVLIIVLVSPAAH